MVLEQNAGDNKPTGDDNLSTIAKNFPKVDFAFAYGSAVFPQSGYDPNVSELPLNYL